MTVAPAERMEVTPPTPAPAEEMGTASRVEIIPVLARLSKGDCEGLVTNVVVLATALQTDVEAVGDGGSTLNYVVDESGGVVPVTMTVPFNASPIEAAAAGHSLRTLQRVSAQCLRESSHLDEQIKIAEIRLMTCSREERSRTQADLRSLEGQRQKTGAAVNVALEDVKNNFDFEVPQNIFAPVLAEVDRVVGSGRVAPAPESSGDGGESDSLGEESDSAVDNGRGRRKKGKLLPAVLVLALATEILVGCAPQAETVENPATEEPTDVPAAKPTNVSVVTPTEVPTSAPTETPRPVRPDFSVEAGGDYSPEMRKDIEEGKFADQEKELEDWVIEVWGEQGIFHPETPLNYKYKFDKTAVDEEGNPVVIVGLESIEYPNMVAFPPLDLKASEEAGQQVFHSVESAGSLSDEDSEPLFLSNDGPVGREGILADSYLAVVDGELVRVDTEGNVVGEIDLETGKWAEVEVEVESTIEMAVSHTYSVTVMGVPVHFTLGILPDLADADEYPILDASLTGDDTLFIHHLTGKEVTSIQLWGEFILRNHYVAWQEDDSDRAGTSFKEYVELVKKGEGAYYVSASFDDPSLSISERYPLHRVKVYPQKHTTVALTNHAKPKISYVWHSGFMIAQQPNGDIIVVHTLCEDSRKNWYESRLDIELRVAGAFAKGFATLAIPEQHQEDTGDVGIGSFIEANQDLWDFFANPMIEKGQGFFEVELE